MTAAGEDILAWLDTTISLHEERAYALGGGKIKVKSYGSGVISLEGAVHLSDGGLHEDEVAWIVLNDPASALRRCAADRKLLELHAPADSHGRFSDGNCPADCDGQHDEPPVCRTCRDYAGDPLPFPCRTVELVAEGYGWTEGER